MSTELPRGTMFWVSGGYELALDESSVGLKLRSELDVAFCSELVLEPLQYALAFQLFKSEVHAGALWGCAGWCRGRSWSRCLDRGGRS
jgi:hypothetical protein